MTSLKELWTQARSRTRWDELFNQMTPHEWKYEADEASSDKFVTADKVVSTDKLWSCYANSGQEQVRWARIVPLVILYVFAGLFLVLLLGWPATPARGSWARGWNIVFFVMSMLSSMVLTFYVADVTLLNRRLIHCLTESSTDWPTKAIQGLRGRWRLAGEPKDVPSKGVLVDYLNIDLIARRTEVVSGLIYYPFITMSLFILSRLSLFDYWTWPLPILILVGFNIIYAAFSAAHLRRTAEQGRQRSLQRLNDLLIAYVAGGKKQEARTTREALSLIRAENRGAFAAISQHPLLRALLLPSGSAGLWALLQYFPRLLAG